MTYWRFNDTHTEQIGYIYLKNNLSTYECDQDKISKSDIFNALGFKIQAGIRSDHEDIASCRHRQSAAPDPHGAS